MVLGGDMHYGTAGHLRGTEGVVVHPETYGGEWGWVGGSVPHSLARSPPFPLTDNFRDDPLWRCIASILDESRLVPRNQILSFVQVVLS